MNTPALLAWALVAAITNAATAVPWLPPEDQTYEHAVPGEPGSDPWWRSLDDPALGRLVELGLEHNHDLASAQASVRSARALAAQAGAALAAYRHHH